MYKDIECILDNVSSKYFLEYYRTISDVFYKEILYRCLDKIYKIWLFDVIVNPENNSKFFVIPGMPKDQQVIKHISEYEDIETTVTTYLREQGYFEDDVL